MVNITRTNKIFAAFFLRIVRKIYFDVFFHDLKKEIKNPDVLFSSYLNLWRKYIHSDGSIYEDDSMLGEVIEEAKKSFKKIVAMDTTTDLFRSYKETKDKFNTIKDTDWVCFEQFSTYKTIFLAFFISIKKDFVYNIEKKYESYFNENEKPLYKEVFQILSYEHIINTVKPKSIFLTCEYSDFHRLFVYTAKINNTPIFALQHGILDSLGYIFTDKEKEKIIPDITFVFGQYHYDILTKKSVYKPNQIVVAGQPRFDILYYANKNYSKKDFFKRYNIPSDHKIVLWTTQCDVMTEVENEKNFDTIFGAIRELDKVTLIIKQHPAETEMHTKIIKNYFKKYDTSARLVPKKSDIYEQLYVCDLMITKHSTTAMEAAALNKPVIVLNLSGEPDIVDFVDQKIALGVYNEKDFKLSVERLLKDDKELEQNRKKFIERYLYKVDGKATERVVNTLKEKLNEIYK